MMQRLKHGGNIRQMMRRYRLAPERIVDFSANINPLGLPGRIKQLMIKNLDALAHYPPPQAEDFKKSLAKRYNLQPENFLAGNGSIELIYLLPRVLRPKKVLITLPSFSEYEYASRLCGAKILFLRTKENDGFKIAVRQFAALIPKADLIFLGNPHNPAGFVMGREQLRVLISICSRHKKFLLVDEAFMDFVEDGERISLIKEAARNKYLLVLRSLTKFFAFAGLRLGYLVGNPGLIRRISRFQYPWNVNILAQIAGEAALKESAYINKSRKFLRRERDYLFKRLQALPGIKVYPAAANFIFCKLEHRRVKTAAGLCAKSAKQGIIIRDCANFRGLGNKFFRVAVRTTNENRKLISTLNKILER